MSTSAAATVPAPPAASSSSTSASSSSAPNAAANGIASSNSWSPSSWRTKPVAQAIPYPDQAALNDTLSRLRTLPGLVTPASIQSLSSRLKDVAQGNAFLLQAGDCAELFEDCREDKIEAKLRLILMMSLVIVWGARVPLVRIGRIAGQYGKPRSSETEKVKIDGQEKVVPTFRGDNVNGFSPTDRTPDPDRLLQAYFHSSATLNHIRGLLDSGFADLHAPLNFSFDHVRDAELQRNYEEIVETITDALGFMKTVGADEGGGGTLNRVEYFVSHEGLILEYEEALTRPVMTQAKKTFANAATSSSVPPSLSNSLADLNATPTSTTAPGEPSQAPATAPASFYNLSTHLLWLGDRTRSLSGAHVEYFRGISNPIGIKVGPSMSPSELLTLLDLVNPTYIPGRVTLIGRFGASKISTSLPPLIAAVQSTPHRHSTIWISDPMHGNTISPPSHPHLKTRRFSDIITELSLSFSLHSSHGSQLQGVHLELTGEVDVQTGESVTECTGGSMELAEEELQRRYRTHCDPRLNVEQSLDVAFLCEGWLRGRRKGKRGPSIVGQ